MVSVKQARDQLETKNKENLTTPQSHAHKPLPQHLLLKNYILAH